MDSLPTTDKPIESNNSDSYSIKDSVGPQSMSGQIELEIRGINPQADQLPVLDAPERKRRNGGGDRRTCLLSMMWLVAILTSFTCYIVFNKEITGLADHYVDFIKAQPAAGVIGFSVVYILSSPICIPPTVFILFGSYMFGRAFGYLLGFLIFVFVDYICLLIGGYLSFLSSRYIFKNGVQKCISTRPKLTALSNALSHNAKKLVFLLRICNLTPYYLFNYVGGVTNMTSIDYIVGNLGIIISDAPYIYVGASLSDISKVSSANKELGVWYYVIIGISIVIVIIVIIMIYFFAKKELKKTIEKGQQEKEDLERQQNEVNEGNNINEENSQNQEPPAPIES